MPLKQTLCAGNSVTERINRFLATPAYIMVIMALTVLTNVLALELMLYTVFILILVYSCFWGEDFLPITPLLICGYIAPSVENNPGRYEASVFQPENGGIYLAFLAAAGLAAVVCRVVRDRKQFFGRRYKLLSGMLILSGAYLLGGIGSKFYFQNAPKSLLFALLNCIALTVPYLLLAGGVNWKKCRKDYLAWVGFGVGCTLLCELIWIYISGNVIRDGIIQRQFIFTGWGMYNNIGSTLAMMIPFPFYLATQYRKGWVGALAGSLFFVGVLLSCSRGSILCGGGIYFLCVILTLYYAHNRRSNTIALIVFTGALAVLLVFFYKPLLELFSSLLDHGLDPSNRDMIYAEGMKLFSKYPIFGGSFFSTEHTAWGWSTVQSFTNILPPRWHNTIIQLLASCGIVGLAAYAYHRVQTVMLFAKTRLPEKLFPAASLLFLVVCCMFDCHFFNIGPVLMYSMILAYCEKQ